MIHFQTRLCTRVGIPLIAVAYSLVIGVRSDATTLAVTTTEDASCRSAKTTISGATSISPSR